MSYSLKFRGELLEAIATVAKEIEDTTRKLTLANVEVSFIGEGEVLKTASFAQALDYIVNDIFWDESGNWSTADSLTWRTM